MKKLLLMLIFSISFLSATGISTSGLTEKQKAEIALQVANMKERTEVSGVSTIDDVVTNLSKFESIGEQTGLAVKRSLEAVVDVADKFSNTPVGQITIALVIWRVVGDTVILLLLGTVIFSIGLKMFNRLFFRRNIPIEYENVPRFWGLYTVRKPSKYITEEPDGDAQAFGVIVLFVATLILIVSISNT